MEQVRAATDVHGGNADVEVAMQDDPVDPDGNNAYTRPKTRERGASLVEYALLLALIAAVCISALSYFGSTNGNGLNRSSSCIKAAQDGQALPANC